jgi:D-beta-D-heptose 7-phosphate kinase/D-beta-D-heptose 1-phosphate adenosyltransferase
MGTLVSIAEAEAVRQALRAEGQTLVLTNGIFDLLHVGHVRYLEAARQLGDALFVGLNSDASARGLKVPTRPFVPQAERAEMLCALASVDYVVIFEEPTAERLVGILQPDIYAKGGDYLPAPDQGKALPEAPVVESYGGSVVILPYSAGHSTSALVERILKASEPTPGG